MPSPIPSDLLAGFQQEVSNRWQEFVTGRPLFFGGINLRKDKNGRIVVVCYSECYYQENLTEKEARERIDLAKQEVAALADAFPQLRAEIETSRVDYEFCYDYKTAAVVVAEEREGVFKTTIRSG
jgi:hypothetical protein